MLLLATLLDSILASLLHACVALSGGMRWAYNSKNFGFMMMDDGWVVWLALAWMSVFVVGNSCGFLVLA